MIPEQFKFFFAKYLTSKSGGGDYTEIELWIQSNAALAPGSPSKYLVISIIWSLFFFTIPPDIEDGCSADADDDFVIWKPSPFANKLWYQRNWDLGVFFSSLLLQKIVSPSVSWRVMPSSSATLISWFYPRPASSPHFVRIHHLVSSVNWAPAKSPHDTIGI